MSLVIVVAEVDGATILCTLINDVEFVLVVVLEPVHIHLCGVRDGLIQALNLDGRVAEAAVRVQQWRLMRRKPTTPPMIATPYAVTSARRADDTSFLLI